jgi:hypothetical protein
MAGMLLFTEQHCAGNGHPESKVAMPAWVCDMCPNVTFVRAEHQPSVLRQTARDLRADATRKVMKSRFVRTRANRALTKSLSRKNRD